MTVVHLARDEKFMPLVQSVFDEAFPGDNRFLVVEPGANAPRHLGTGPGIAWRPSRTFRTAGIAADLAGARLIVAHGMTTDFARALRHAPAACVVAWIGWGYDYMRLLQQRTGDLLLPQTGALEARLQREQAGRGLGAWLARPLVAVGQAIDRRLRARPPAVVSVAARIDVFSCNPSEESALREAMPALQAPFHAVPSFTAEDVFDRGAPRMAGPDVLLGNSATPTNNHLEALTLLQGRLPPGGRLIAPLNYGDRRYGEAVAAAGRRAFGDRFVALTDWMPIDAYQQRIASCAVVVMNHRRQQAVGNIGAALYKGAAVYLRVENPLWGFYTGLGVTLRPLDELEAMPGAPLRPLSADEQLRNRQAIERRYSRHAVVAAARALAGFPRRDPD